MIIFVAIDNNNGTMFNNRRQSRDRVLCSKMLTIADGATFWINTYSQKLFIGFGGVEIADDFLDRAGTGEYCFVENVPLAPYVDKIEKIYLIKWNRVYPSDTYFDLDMSLGWNLQSAEDFEGLSHDKITMEVYVK